MKKDYNHFSIIELLAFLILGFVIYTAGFSYDYEESTTTTTDQYQANQSNTTASSSTLYGEDEALKSQAEVEFNSLGQYHVRKSNTTAQSQARYYAKRKAQEEARERARIERMRYLQRLKEKREKEQGDIKKRNYQKKQQIEKSIKENDKRTSNINVHIDRNAASLYNSLDQYKPEINIPTTKGEDKSLWEKFSSSYYLDIPKTIASEVGKKLWDSKAEKLWKNYPKFSQERVLSAGMKGIGFVNELMDLKEIKDSFTTWGSAGLITSTEDYALGTVLGPAYAVTKTTISSWYKSKKLQLAKDEDKYRNAPPSPFKGTPEEAKNWAKNHPLKTDEQLKEELNLEIKSKLANNKTYTDGAIDLYLTSGGY